MWFFYPMLILYVSQCQELEEGEGGDFLFFSNNDEFAEESHILGKAKSACDDKILSSYLISLQVFNPESVIALATKNKMEKICHNISRTIDHMESYLKSCHLDLDQETYVHLLNGVKALHKKICTRDPYHHSFMEHKKCYSQLQTEIDSCNGPADWSDNSDSKRVCRAYQEVADCYYIKASVLCGNKAADIFKELVNSVIDSVLTVNCSVNLGTEDQRKQSKEQRLMLQKQKLGQTKSDHVETASSQSLHTSGAVKLLMQLFAVTLSKLVRDIV